MNHKEKLEEIKLRYQKIDALEQIYGPRETLIINQNDFDWIIDRVEKLTAALKEINEFTGGFGDENIIPQYWRDELIWRCQGISKKALEDGEK